VKHNVNIKTLECHILRMLEDGEEREHGVDEAAGVGNEQLLMMHLQRRHKQLRGRHAAPQHRHRRQQHPQYTSGIGKKGR